MYALGSPSARCAAPTPDPSGVPRRVAFLIWGRGLGGGEVLLCRFLEGLDRRRFEPVVIATGEGRLSRRLCEMGVPVYWLPLDRECTVAGGLSLPWPGTLARLLSVLRRERIDLIHSFSLETRNYAHAAAMLSRRPLLHTSQDTWFGDGFRAAQWWLLNRVPARVIATSDAVLRSLRVGTRLDPRQVVKIPPGVDLTRFAPPAPAQREALRREVRAEFALPADAHLIGTVGRLNRDVKGFDVLFDAAEQIFLRDPRAHLLVIGDAELLTDRADPVRACVRGTPLESTVIFAGHRRDVARLMSAMDVLVSASPRESFGLVLAEAAACGIPAAATRSGGAQEVVVHGETGLLVPVGDPAALARAVLRVLRDSERAVQMGRAGRLRAEREFDLRRMTRRIEAEYLRALESSG